MDFIACLVSIWDSLVISISSDSLSSANLRSSMNELTGRFSHFLAKQTIPGTFNLAKRSYVPDWISQKCFVDGECLGLENLPPALNEDELGKQTMSILTEADASDEESNISLAEFREVSLHISYELHLAWS